MDFKELLNAKVALSQVLLKSSLHLLYQNRLLLKHGYMVHRETCDLPTLN